MASKHTRSPVGAFRYCHVNEPDYKAVERFGPNTPLRYKVDLILPAEKADPLVAEIDALLNEKHAEVMASLTAADIKRMEKAGEKVRKKFPYSDQEDDQGNPTGSVIFHFTQNAQIKLKDGTTKTVAIAIFDKAGKAVTVKVFGGARGAVSYAPRVYYNQATKEVGVTLDFSAVQISSLGGGAARSMAPLEDDDEGGTPFFADGEADNAGGDGEDSAF